MLSMLLRVGLVGAAAAVAGGPSVPSAEPERARVVLDAPAVVAGDVVEVVLHAAAGLRDARLDAPELGWKQLPMGPHSRGPSDVMGTLPMVPRTTPPGAYLVRAVGHDAHGDVVEAQAILTVLAEDAS